MQILGSVLWLPQISSQDALDYATATLAAATIVLAAITWLYLRETTRIRKISQNPSFSLEPDEYMLGEAFFEVNLVNSGQAANDIFVDCTWDAELKKFHIMSLSKDGRAKLDVPITLIVSKKQKLKVSVRCKDTNRENYETTLEVDFATATADSRQLVYQYNVMASIEQRLKDIDDHLRNP